MSHNPDLDWCVEPNPNIGRTVDTPCIEHGQNCLYGGAMVNGQRHNYMRAVWIRANGPIPPGLLVCHACDNPRCINLDHLWLGTVADNARDASVKRRHKNNRKTECSNGHAFDEANTYIRSGGGRVCRACRRDNMARYYAQKRASA